MPDGCMQWQEAERIYVRSIRSKYLYIHLLLVAGCFLLPFGIKILLVVASLVQCVRLFVHAFPLNVLIFYT